MLLKKLLLFLVFVTLGPPLFGQTGHFEPALSQPSSDLEKEKHQRVSELVDFFYNNFESAEKNLEAQKSAWELLQTYPDDPYLYDLWASIEWWLLGHELNLKVGEKINISELPELKDKAEKFHKTVLQGLALTEGKDDIRSLFARAVLILDEARFIYRFEDDLSESDKKTAEAISNLKKILDKDPSFYPVYFILGSIRYSLTVKIEEYSLTKIVKLAVSLKSYTYEQLYKFDENVFDKRAALEWIEVSYNYNYKDSRLKKNWTESAFILAGAYADYRKGVKLGRELQILDLKELPLLEKLHQTFPNRKDVSEKLKLARAREGLLKNYLSQKK